MPEVIKGLEVSGVVAHPETTPFDVAERTDLAVAAFDSLGLVKIDRSAVTEHVSEHMQRLHDSLRVSHSVESVEPFMSIELSEKFGLRVLVRAFDLQQTEETYIYGELWDQYSVAELNSRQIGKLGVAGSTEGLSSTARGMVLGGDQLYSEAGLHFTDKSLKEQKEAVGNRQVINPADCVMLNAQRREEGIPLLDSMTFTRFPQLEMKRAGGDSWVPGAYSYDGQLYLDRSDDRALSGGGVRLSVGPEA